MKVSALLVALLSLGIARAAAQDAHPKHWGYSGEVGPDHWQQFGSDFGACGDGRNQSPVDLRNFIEAQLPPIAFDYRPGGHQVVNNGHAIQVDYAPGSKITVDGTDFLLKQFHFHVPSENHVDGKSFPMEAHFVHSDAKGNLAVVALMFEEGASNQVLEQVWPLIPKEEDGKAALSPAIAAADLIGAERDYYRYDGSLTTPPCSEGVRWFVLKRATTASAEQMKMVSDTLGQANNRPVQPINARAILR